ncbi:MAG TPA: hypothetical protein VH482_22235 [Thermomicrobiales bacterium]
MAIGMFMRWNGITKEQYDTARALAPFNRDTAPGSLFHVAAFDEQGIRVTDVWESAEQWQTYLSEQLVPAFAKLGFPGQPEVEIIPVHALIAPGYERI